jgi:hypothetical protein
MDNNRVDYQEDVEEGFSNGINQDIALKAIIFSMLFYIVDSKLLAKLIENYTPIKLFGRDLIKAMIFALFFYFISVTIS